MNQTISRQTGTLKAKDESGNQHQIIEYTDFIITQGFGAEPEELEGLKDYKLADGRQLNKNSDNEFEIVQSGVKLFVE